LVAICQDVAVTVHTEARFVRELRPQTCADS
jgi:hypothetical protein